MAFWLLFTPRQKPGVMWVLRMAWSISRFGIVYPNCPSGPAGLRPWNTNGSMPSFRSCGSRLATIDWPEMRMCKRGEIALRIERARQLALRDRMITAMRHVLFARPDQLDRCAGHLLGDQHRLRHVVMRRCAPAEAAAKMHAIDSHLVTGRPDAAAADGERGFGVLRWRPDLALVGGPQRRRIHRLHGRVILVRNAVGRLDLLGGAGERGFGVALLVADERLLGGETFLEHRRDCLRSRPWRFRLRPRRSAAHRSQSWRATRCRRRLRRHCRRPARPS